MGRMAGQFAKPRAPARRPVTASPCRPTAATSSTTMPSLRRPASRPASPVGRRTTTPREHAEPASAPSPAAVSPICAGSTKWNHGFPVEPGLRTATRSSPVEIDRAIRFMEAARCGLRCPQLVEFFATHEALLLDYEERCHPDRLPHGSLRGVRRTSSGSVSGPVSSTARTSTSCPASTTRSVSSSDPRRRSTTSCVWSTSSTRSASPAA